MIPASCPPMATGARVSARHGSWFRQQIAGQRPGVYVEAEGILSDVLQSLQGTGEIVLTPNDFCLLTGAPLALFSSGASAVPGLAIVDSKALAVRWNNNATLDGILASFAMPNDCDITENMVVQLRASKTGATLADAPTFAVGAYNQVIGALHDADTNFGGNSGAMTGDDVAAKTIQVVTRTLAAAGSRGFSGNCDPYGQTHGRHPRDR